MTQPAAKQRDAVTLSAPSNVLTQERAKGTAEQPAERGSNRALIGGLIFAQLAVLHTEIILVWPSFDLK